MIKPLFAATAAALTLCAATPAAAGIPYGYQEFTDPVMPLPAGASGVAGEQVYLCHLVRKFHLAFVPVFYWSEGYVLGERACTTDHYTMLTPDQLANLKTTGILPAKLPAAPSLSWAQRSPMIAEALIVLGLFMAFRRASQRQQQRFAAMGDGLAEISKRVLDTLCHAARATGLTDANGVALIRQVTEKATGQSVSDSAILNTLSATKPRPSHYDQTRFAKGLTADQCDTLLHAILLMFTAANVMGPEARRFVNGFVTAARISKKRLGAILAKLPEPA